MLWLIVGWIGLAIGLLFWFSFPLLGYSIALIGAICFGYGVYRV